MPDDTLEVIMNTLKMLMDNSVSNLDTSLNNDKALLKVIDTLIERVNLNYQKHEILIRRQDELIASLVTTMMDMEKRIGFLEDILIKKGLH